MRIHSDRAPTLGVTPKEVLEAMEVPAIPVGMPGLWLDVETLKEFLEHRGQHCESVNGSNRKAVTLSIAMRPMSAPGPGCVGTRAGRASAQR